jgi:lipopolysaccharide/colanic/teichoic acid biosynthesis glycosyltransferase
MADKGSTAQVRDGLPRPLEVGIAAVALIVAAPVLLLLAVAIAVTSPGPVIFRQERLGRNGRPFILYKLRTMRTSLSGPQVTARDDSRITPLGRLVRLTKLDEVLALWNVVRGDMSLVGPRPEVPRYVDLANPAWKKVLRARPGMTDPVTLRLRNEEALLSAIQGDREKFYLDTLQPYKVQGYLEYLERRDWKSDVVVIWHTLVAVLIPGMAGGPTVDEVSAGRCPPAP